jgi:hypothetical protein
MGRNTPASEAARFDMVPLQHGLGLVSQIQSVARSPEPTGSLVKMPQLQWMQVVSK